MKISSLGLIFLLFASLSFAWVVNPPSCLTTYTVAGANFTWMNANSLINCPSNNILLYGQLGGPITASQHLKYFSNQSYVSITWDGGQIGSPISLNNIPFPSSGNYTGATSSSGGLLFSCSGGSSLNSGAFTLNQTSPTTYNYSFSGSAIACNITGGYNLTGNFDSTNDTFTVQAYPTGSAYEFGSSIAPGVTLTPANDYIGVYDRSGATVRSDFLNNTGLLLDNTSTYCRELLYFNSPYAGTFQLIPKITYSPGVFALGNFFNSTDNSAYVPNNTIIYVYDTLTTNWYTVPPTTCSSPNVVGTISTLQYNPTALAPGTVGTIPIQVSSLNGACTYVPITRTITCTGLDSSNTLVSLNLSAYPYGNSSLACSNGLAGASGSVACTLPNINGSYSVYFYGMDNSQLYYTFATYTYTVGNQGQTVYGRDGFLAAVMLFVVVACLWTANIAVSIILGIFAIFVLVGFGVLPPSTGAVAAFFAVIALMMVYRMKV